MNTISHLSVKQLKKAIKLREKIEVLEARLSEVINDGGEMPVPFFKTAKRKMSASARKAIGDAQRRRWAKQKGESVKPAKMGRKKMSAAAKAKISASAKLRWKKAKEAGKSRL